MEPNYPTAAKLAEKMISNQLEGIAAKAYLSHLPTEIFVKILYKLELKDVLSVSAVSKELRKSGSIPLSKFFYDHPKIGRGKHFIQNLLGLLQSDASHVYRLDLSEFEKIKSKDLEKIFSVFPQIEDFRFPKQIKSKQIALIKPLAKLKTLHCQSEQITNLEFFPFESLMRLETLSLDRCCRISIGWSQLHHLSRLKKLILSSIPENLDYFYKLTSLEFLALNQPLSQEQSQAFSSLTSLKQLTYLKFLSIYPELKFHIEKLSQLEQLDCSNIIEQCPAFYENLTSLKVLNVDQAKVNSTFLASLSQLKSLTKIAFNAVNEEFSLKSLQHLNVLTALKEISVNCNEYDNKGPDEILLEGLFNLQKLHLSFEFLKDIHLDKIKDFTNLKDLKLDHCENLSDQTLSKLKDLTKLTKLSLKNCPSFTSQGLLGLNLRNLKELELSECRFGQALIPLFSLFTQLATLGLNEANFGFTEILKFTNLQTLKSLAVKRASFNPRDFNLIGKFTNLQFLNIKYLGGAGGAQLSDELTVNLKNLTLLTSLNLNYNQELTDQTIQSLAGLTNLKTLALSTLKITNRGVKYLSNLHNLVHLEMDGTQIKGSEGIKYLVKLHKLEWLSIRHCQVRQSDLKALKKLRPSTQIFL